MTRIITICSGKGGVGKTFLTANLGTALAELGKDTVAVDANLTTPNLGLHLGVPLYPVTLHDVLKGSARIADAIYEHSSGLKVVPSGIALKDMRGVDARDFPNALLDLLGNTDIVLVDSAAGLGREALAALEASDELLLLTNPELPSVADALKAAKLATQLGTKVGGLVINRVSGQKFEMSEDAIRSMLDGMQVLASIPEDRAVQHAISRRVPLVQYAPHAKASRAVRKLAHYIAGRYYREPPWYSSLLRW